MPCSVLYLFLKPGMASSPEQVVSSFLPPLLLSFLLPPSFPKSNRSLVGAFSSLQHLPFFYRPSERTQTPTPRLPTHQKQELFTLLSKSPTQQGSSISVSSQVSKLQPHVGALHLVFCCSREHRWPIARDKASSVFSWTTECAPESPFLPLQHTRRPFVPGMLQNTDWTQIINA